jgi:hypothetical protein
MTDLKIIITGDNKASPKLREVKKDLDNLNSGSKDAKKNFQNLNAVGLESLQNSIKEVEDVLKGVGVLSVGALAGFATYAIGSADKFKQNTNKYTTVLGSIEEAEKRLAELQKIADISPFKIDNLVKADIILQGFGIRSEDLLKKIGNASSITGDSISDLALIFGQLSQSKDLENIKQLVERGVISFNELKNAGISFNKDGSVVNSVDETFNTILQIVEKKFAGGMELQATTIEGRWSTLVDSVNTKSREIAISSGALDLVNSSLLGFNDLLINTEKYIPILAGVGTSFTILATGSTVALMPSIISLTVASWALLSPWLSLIALAGGVGVAIYLLASIYQSNFGLINQSISDFFVWGNFVWESTIITMTNFVFYVKDNFVPLITTALLLILNPLASLYSAWNSNLFGIRDTTSSIFGQIDNFLTGFSLYNIGKNIMLGLINGVNSMNNQVKNSIVGAMEGAVNNVKSFLGIKSPSRLFKDEIAINIMLGLINGVNSMNNQVKNSIVGAMEGAVNNVKSFLGKNAPDVEKTMTNLSATTTAPMSAGISNNSSSISNNSSSATANITINVQKGSQGNSEQSDQEIYNWLIKIKNMAKKAGYVIN